MTREMTYDSRCHDLAEAFLADHPDKQTPEHTHMLAWLIQQTIEDYLQSLTPRFADHVTGGDEDGRAKP